MSRTIECRLEGQQKSEEFPVDRYGKVRIEGRKPKQIYEIRENGEDWSSAKRVKADDKGVIEGQTISFRI